MAKAVKQETLDLSAVKDLIRQISEDNEQLSEKDIMELAEKNHLDEEEEDELFAWCQENDIYVIDPESDYLEEEESEEEEEEPVAPYVEEGKRTHIHDSEMQYLHEIGQIPLLTPEQEKETGYSKNVILTAKNTKKQRI